MNISALLQIIPVFLILILLGYAGAKTGRFTAEFTQSASALVMNVFLSASVFNSICGEVPDISGSDILQALLIMTLTVVLCTAIAILSVRLLRKKLPDAAPPEMSLYVMNALLVGLPIIQEVYGPLAVLYTGLFSIPLNVNMYTYGIWRMSSTGSGGKMNLRALLTPCFIVTVLSMIVFALRIPIPGMIRHFAEYAAGATMPMSMIVVGATMGAENLLDAFRDRRVYVLSFMRLIISPLLVLAVLSCLTQDVTLIRVAVVLAACPCGMIVPIFSLRYGHDAVLPSECVMVSTLLSMATIPLIVWLVG